MDTSDIILWTVIAMVYAVTVGPLIARFIQLYRKDDGERKGEPPKFEGKRGEMTLTLSDADWRILDSLAQDRQQSSEDVAMQALRLGFEAMKDTVTIHLSPRDAERLAEMIDNPPSPSAKFQEAKRRHRELKDRGYRGQDYDD